MELQVQLLEENGVQRFILVGEIDAFTESVLRESFAAVENEQGVQVEINLSEVAYMDSTGLGVFVGFYKTVKSNGGNVRITGLNTRLRRLFQITGLDEIMDIEIAEGGASDATV